MKRIPFILIFIGLCTACNPDKVDTGAIRKDLEDFKIKKITQGEILSSASLKGSLITDSLQSAISANLDSALSKGGVLAAIPFCILSNYSLFDELEKNYNAKISRTSFPEKLRNQKSAPDDLQKEILDAYAYNLEKGQSVFKDVQVREKEIIFNAPIMLSENQCLRCHGTPEKDLSKAEYQAILSQYPQDKSVNLKMQDFMGMWTVKFSKKEFIKEIK